MRTQKSALLAALLSVGFFAAACGGSDGDSGGGSEPSDTEGGDSTTTLVFDTDEPAETEAPTSDAESTDTEPAATAADSEPTTTVAADEPLVGGDIIYGIDTDGTGFDTTSAIPAGTLRIVSALNDSLVGVDKDLNWVPNLAESLEPNADFTEWRINLRDGVTFHDGEPVDAAAVAANLNAFKDSATTGFSLGPVNSVVAEGENTVVVTMSTPWAAFPFMLTSQSGFMVSPSTIGQNDTFVGTGPFKLESWTPGDSARVVRNDDYWRGDEGYPYLDAITFKVLPDQNGRRQAFLAGDIDAYSGPSDSHALEFSQDDNIVLLGSTAPANEALVILNTTAAPTDDVRIRRAMAHATDRDLLIETFRSGLTLPADGFIEPDSRWFTENGYPELDPELAATLVAEYEAEVGPAEITVKVANVPGRVEVVELLAGLWSGAGIDVTIEKIAPGTDVTPVITDDFQAIYWFQFSGVDPDTEYVFFHSSGGPLNWSNFVDPEIDEGFDAARATEDGATRAEGYARVLTAMGEQVPMIWLDHLGGIDIAVSRPYVHDIGEGTFSDGTPTVGLYNGHYHSWENVWRSAE